MKFVAPLSDEEQTTLNEAYRHHPAPRVRQRAQAILLNAQGYTMTQLKGLFAVRLETVSSWMTNWETKGVVGLFDPPRSGRTPSFTPEEVERFIRYIDENPHQPKAAAARLQEETGKKASADTFRRLLKKKNYRWKRCWKSVKNKRDEALFERDTEVMSWLQQLEDEGQINLAYFDESGFSLTPVVPYGWQPVGETFRIPCHHSPRVNVLGFMRRDNPLFYHAVEGRVTSETVIAAFDEFAEHYYETEFKRTGKICFVPLDNASIHRSQAFMDKKDDWLLRGICPRFIPPYCPELNLIEILWRKVKYEWLPMQAYQSSFEKLKTSVKNVLDQVGDKFWITFA